MRMFNDVEVVPCSPDCVIRDARWPVAVSPVHRAPSPARDFGTSPALTDLAWATVQVRTALEEMTVAARAAVAGARAIVEVMDAAVAVLEVAERASASESLPDLAHRRGAGLSPREREVLALVAEGRSNKAIAEELYLSPNTIKTHIASLMNKLNAESRAHLAAIAARQEGPRKATPALRDQETLAS
jgi:DNA-binding CsgD family transcriptional regulator